MLKQKVARELGRSNQLPRFWQRVTTTSTSGRNRNEWRN
jgi:hypothetical protein